MAAGESGQVLNIDGRESFDMLVRKLSVYFIQHIDAPHSFEDLRKTVYGRAMKPLTDYLAGDVHHQAIISALLALKWHFSAVETGDDRGISDTRGLACELVAWRFVTHLSEREAIDYLCYELPTAKRIREDYATKCDTQRQHLDGAAEAVSATDETPLLDNSRLEADDSSREEGEASSVADDGVSFASTFAGLNALEIATVSGSKHFISQRAVQRVIDGIWKGDVVFWETLSTHSTKKAKLYNKDRSDPFCRLRVPLYLKMFEVMFFAAFLAFYYTVLIQKSAHQVTTPEVFLYILLAAFTYNEFGEFWDAGTVFYATDFWSLWDLGIIATGVAFFIVRIVGLSKRDDHLTEVAFDVLSVEALFLVPRICSLLSLHPYFGTLLPCLKEMTKDFIKFLGLVAILYIGFNTTFAFLARGTYSVAKMNWILIKVFFGSSYLGFDVAERISPILGPPLMFVFVCMTNILLITSLISLLSNSLTKVMQQAREEYLSVYAVFVLEASNSNRLTYFLPPLNLLPLTLRPLRLFMSAESLRHTRIVLLKATHWPFVALILAFEAGRLRWEDRRKANSSSARPVRGPISPAVLRRPLAARPMHNPLLAAGTCQGQMDDSAPQPRGAGPSVQQPLQKTSAATSETIEALEIAVANLKTQVETLTSLIETQRTRIY